MHQILYFKKNTQGICKHATKEFSTGKKTKIKFKKKVQSEAGSEVCHAHDKYRTSRLHVC